MKNIFVGNLSFRTIEDELREIFEPFGEIARIQVVKDRDTGQSRGFAFVEMADDEAGNKAIAALDGKEIGGRQMKVSEAKPKEPRFAGGGRGQRDFGGNRGSSRGRDRW